MKSVSISVTLATLLLSGLALAKAPHLHVDVENPKGDDTHLALPLEPNGSPFGEALSKVRPGGGLEVTASKLKTAWGQVTAAGGVYTITVEDVDGLVKVSEKRGEAVIEKEGPGQKRMIVRLPVVAMESLLAGQDKLDFDGALRTLQQRGKQEAIALEGSDGGTVRIRID